MNKIKIVLTENQANSLVNYLDELISKQGCNHKRENALKWAKLNNINFDDFIDILNENGCFCDCEVVLNLPEKCDIELDDLKSKTDNLNPLKIPENYKIAENKLYNKALFSSKNEKCNDYANDGELLIPAPIGIKPKKRIRKSVHFFIGVDSELPNEIGFVKSIEPITANLFAKKLRDSKIDPFKRITEKEADFYLSKIEKVDLDKPMGTYFMEKNGFKGKKIELRIHKVILQK